jgi:hypothetical protein
VAIVEQQPTLEGWRMTLTLAPDTGAPKPAAGGKPAAAQPAAQPAPASQPVAQAAPVPELAADSSS